MKIIGGNVKEGRVVFPICYRGESTYQTIMMKNTSSLPAVFKIQINALTRTHTGTGTDSESGIYVDVRMSGNFACV